MVKDNILTILGIERSQINWFPQNIIEEIIQNVAVLLVTIVGSVPLDRNLGLDATFIDEPSPRGMMKFRIFAIETIQQYEPRVEITEVDFIRRPNEASDGRLYPRIKVRILDEYIT